jgi:hypothetical protein
LDIAKAFDFIFWTYLLKLMQRLDFGAKWRDWITLPLSTSSSRILLNGTPGKPIKHERELKQGGPNLSHAFHLSHGPSPEAPKKGDWE